MIDINKPHVTPIEQNVVDVTDHESIQNVMYQHEPIPAQFSSNPFKSQNILTTVENAARTLAKGGKKLMPKRPGRYSNEPFPKAPKKKPKTVGAGFNPFKNPKTLDSQLMKDIKRQKTAQWITPERQKAESIEMTARNSQYVQNIRPGSKIHELSAWEKEHKEQVDQLYRDDPHWIDKAMKETPKQWTLIEDTPEPTPEPESIPDPVPQPVQKTPAQQAVDEIGRQAWENRGRGPAKLPRGRTPPGSHFSDYLSSDYYKHEQEVDAKRASDEQAIQNPATPNLSRITHPLRPFPVKDISNIRTNWNQRGFQQALGMDERQRNFDPSQAISLSRLSETTQNNPNPLVTDPNPLREMETRKKPNRIRISPSPEPEPSFEPFVDISGKGGVRFSKGPIKPTMEDVARIKQQLRQQYPRQEKDLIPQPIVRPVNENLDFQGFRGKTARRQQRFMKGVKRSTVQPLSQPSLAPTDENPMNVSMEDPNPLRGTTPEREHNIPPSRKRISPSPEPDPLAKYRQVLDEWGDEMDTGEATFVRKRKNQEPEDQIESKVVKRNTPQEQYYQKYFQESKLHQTQHRMFQSQRQQIPPPSLGSREQIIGAKEADLSRREQEISNQEQAQYAKWQPRYKPNIFEQFGMAGESRLFGKSRMDLENVQSYNIRQRNNANVTVRANDEAVSDLNKNQISIASQTPSNNFGVNDNLGFQPNKFKYSNLILPALIGGGAGLLIGSALSDN